jgi:hypothetical protein
MFRSWIAELLSLFLVLNVPFACDARGTAQEKAPTIQEQLVSMQAGSVVEVKTKTKMKVKGRLGALTADSFEVQSATGAKIERQSFRFDEVKSVKQVAQGSRTHMGAWIALGVVAGIGVAVAALVIGYFRNQ